MNATLDIWRLLTGIVIFLLGMNFMEEGIKSLVGRPFKLFLKKQTSNPLKAIMGGAAVTAIVQSSSVVNLMVLAFVGAGVIQLQNALEMMLGANLGTTLTSWMVATVGFKFNIENFAYAIAGVSGMIMLLSNKEGRLHQWSKMICGFGFLFVGLNFIRLGIEDALKEIDLAAFNEQPAIVFLLIGLAITAIVQASSATIAIVLSALHADAIDLFPATAVVLGAEIGTTLKLILASAKGTAVKKRVALGNVLFNTITILLVFAALAPINRFITDVVGIKDNLIALVFFQSLTNIVGILLFFPFLGSFARWLEKRYVSGDNETLFIHKVKKTDTDLAIVALEKETKYLIYYTSAFALEAFGKKPELLLQRDLDKEFFSRKLMEKYEFIKQVYAEIHSYSTGMQQHTSDSEMTIRLNQLVDTARNTMYAAKNIKDAMPDIEQLRKSSNDVKHDFYLRTGKRITRFLEQVLELLAAENKGNNYELLSTIYESMQAGYKELLNDLHKEELQNKLNEIEFSTIVNFNREIYTCEKSMIFALKDYLLDEKEAGKFDELPGFIR
jgi:phosphate:Na+ symporter